MSLTKPVYDTNDIIHIWELFKQYEIDNIYDKFGVINGINDDNDDNHVQYVTEIATRFISFGQFDFTNDINRHYHRVIGARDNTIYGFAGIVASIFIHNLAISNNYDALQGFSNNLKNEFINKVIYTYILYKFNSYDEQMQIYLIKYFIHDEYIRHILNIDILSNIIRKYITLQDLSL